MRALVPLVLLLGASACATTPAYVYRLADAPDEEARSAAAVELSTLLRNPRTAYSVRMAAARTIGRLGAKDPSTVAALETALFSDRSPRELRAYAAWALGELRSRRSLAVLTKSLHTTLDPLVAEHVLQALAKHYAVMSADHETLVEIVEALVYFAGNHRGGALPATYDLLSANTRTLPVNVEVLDRAIRHVEKSGSAPERAAMYNAALELLSRLESNVPEIVAGSKNWEGRVRSALEVALRAVDTDDARTTLLVVWYLGRLGAVREIGAPAAKALIKRDTPPTQSDDVRERLVATWALARMQVHAFGPRRTLLLDILSKELEPKVLELVGDASSRPGELDLAQKLLGVGDKK